MGIKEGEKEVQSVVLDNFEFVDSKQDSAGMGERQPAANIAAKSTQLQFLRP